jgi:hypothetical protein
MGMSKKWKSTEDDTLKQSRERREEGGRRGRRGRGGGGVVILQLETSRTDNERTSKVQSQGPGKEGEYLTLHQRKRILRSQTVFGVLLGKVGAMACCC